MRLGLVSDIHGNAAMLEAALRAMGEIDRLVCLGDAISQYKFSNETVEILRAHAAITIAGNHEEVFFGPHGQRARAAGWIDPALMAWLAEQPPQRTLECNGKSLLLVHSCPWAPHAYIYPHSPAFARFAESGADFVLYGHTHAPVARQVGRTLVVNPGSTGEGQTAQGEPMCSCAVLDIAAASARLIHLAH